MSAEQDRLNQLNQQIEDVLDRLRPFLQREGGNIHLERFDLDTGICYVTMSGACNGCYMAESDISDSIEVLLMDEIPEIKHVQLVQPEGMSFQDMLRRLQEEERANAELSEYNRNRNN